VSSVKPAAKTATFATSALLRLPLGSKDPSGRPERTPSSAKEVTEFNAQLEILEASLKVVAATATLKVKTEVIETASAARAAVNFLNELIFLRLKGWEQFSIDLDFAIVRSEEALNG